MDILPPSGPASAAGAAATGDATLDLAIAGMSCASCVGRVERAARRVPGIGEADVNLATEQARLRYDGTAATRDAVLAAIGRAGYEAREIVPADADGPAPAPPARDRERLRLLAAVVLATPLLGDMAWRMAGGAGALPPAADFVLGTLMQFGVGARFYVASLASIRARTGNMDLLVALGTTAAWGLSTANWIAARPGHPPALFYETAALLILFVLGGKWLERRARAETASAIHALERLRPADARRLDADGRETTVPLSAIRVGDRIRVRPGERIPVDAIVRDGAAAIDEQMLTGENVPVRREAGDTVAAGGLATDGVLVIETTAVGAETTLARLVRAVADASAGKPPVQRLADRVSAVFVPAVIGVAVLTLAVSLALGRPADAAILAAVAVLVVACPCALGLATPTAIVAGTGVAARHGILLRDAAAIEQAGTIRLVAFDKTGTLTEGRPVLRAAPEAPGPLRLAAALAGASEHPLARAVLAAAVERGVAVVAADAVRVEPGRGIGGTVDGRTLLFGSRRMLADAGFDLDPHADAMARHDAAGETVSLLGDGATHEILGLFAFADGVRDGAREAVAALQAAGLAVAILTGDHQAAAAAVGRATGVTVIHAGLLPADKAAALGTLRAAHGPVAMVGDGINDAPALAAADLGLAIGTGTDVAIGAAAVTLMRADPRLVPATLAVGRRIVGTIRRGLFWAFAFNVVAIPLAASGLLQPALAGAAMALSSVAVVLNALTLRLWTPARN